LDEEMAVPDGVDNKKGQRPFKQFLHTKNTKKWRKKEAGPTDGNHQNYCSFTEGQKWRSRGDDKGCGG